MRIGAHTSGSKGFSLIEVTIGILILGILMIPTIAIYEKYRQDHIRAASETYPRAIADALRKYAILYGRYPRPARPDVASTAADFGREAPLATYPNCSATSTVVCRTTPSATQTLIGTVPFAEIGLPREMSFDGYGRRFTYAVTESLTSSGTFSDTGGRIAVNTGITSNHPDTPEDDRFPEGITTNNIHFVIISHGPNGAGAFTNAASTKFAPCPPAAVSFERANCDNNSVFQEHRELAFRSDLGRFVRLDALKSRNLANNANYFDDILAFNTTIAGADWTRISTDTDVISRTNGRIQIGPNPAPGPLPVATVDVYGNVRANTLQTQRLCDDGPGCTSAVFSPDVIGGVHASFITSSTPPYNDSQINCGGRALTGISNANEECTYSGAPGLAGGCIPPDAMAGVDAGGDIICVSP